MKTIRLPLSILLLAGAVAHGGTFTADFATQDTSTFFLNGSGTLADQNGWFPLIATNRLIMTVNQNNLSGSFSPNDFDAGAPIDSFIATFKLQFGPGTSTPADGAAFSFGPDVNQSSTTYNEVGAGGASFAVSFHTYTSNGGPAVDVYLHGQRIGHVPVPVAQMVNSQLQDVVIQLKRNSTLNVTYAGQVLYTNLYLPGWGPTNGFFIVSARTGGANEETDLANVSINTTLFTTTTAPTITLAPKPATVNEGGSTNFTVGFDGTGPFWIQWLKNGSPIQDATNQTLTFSPAAFADNNANISVTVSNLTSSITSPSATLTVIRDTTAPTVTKTAADTTFTSILITYSKPVSDTALNASNYSIDQGATVSTVDRINSQTVKLTTSQLTQGVTYTVTINGIQDTSTIPNSIAANTKVQVHPFVYLTGSVLHKKYNNVDDNTGYPLANLFNDPRYPDAPDRVDIESSFEYPPGGAGRIAADPTRDYFDSVEGFFIPPVTTNYVFFIAGADRVSLFLSTDDSPANKNQIANINGWTNPRGWNQGQGGTDMSTARSDANLGTSWPFGNTISLTAGQKYYLLLVHHDPSWSGGDDFGATYKIDGENDPAVGDPSKLAGSVVGFYFDPTGASINFALQPTNTTATQGNTATLSALAAGISVYGTNVLYQWQSAPQGSTTFTNIPGATGATYTTPLLGASDNGTQYRVVATVAPITQTSSVVTLTVASDTAPPVVSAGAMPDSVAGTVDVGVGFDKPIGSSVGQIANYSISGGTIASLTVYTNRFTSNSQNPLAEIVKQSVLLKVIGLTGNSGVLTVKNIADTHGNTLASTNVPFTVSSMQWGVVGANELGGTNAVVPVAANGFDLYSDGIAEWANYDEATFVYEQVSGDFDKKLRVEYQDGSSQWARAGLIVRDTPDFGADRNSQTNGAAGRYQKCFVAPVGATLTGPGTPGAQDWELNRRLLTGGQTDGAPLTGTVTVPQYPNAWCRIQRTGQKFTMFRSDDGVNWVTLGETTFGVDGGSTNMPNTVYVGPEYSPENGNLTVPADRGTFLAQIRDYGNFVGAFNPQLSVARGSDGKVTITWSAGTLVSSPTVVGTYTAVQGATSPFVVTPTAGTTTFYRVKQ
jgi:hypothetical protein